MSSRTRTTKPRLHILTYATHAGGTFELLLADTQHYHLPMTVLGWGEPWTGFFGKLCALHAYASALNASAADDILIVIDAFDTRVTGTMQTIEEIHAKYFSENGIVFSVCNKIPFLSRQMSDTMLVKIFEVCTWVRSEACLRCIPKHYCTGRLVVAMTSVPSTE